MALRILSRALIAEGLIALLACMSGATAQEPIELRDFSCYPSINKMHPYYGCYLKSGATFLGVRTGMKSKSAFDHICAHLPGATWNTRSRISRKTSPVARGLYCRSWPIFEKADVWYFAAAGYPCAGPRFLTILLQNNSVSYVNAICTPTTNSRKH